MKRKLLNDEEEQYEANNRSRKRISRRIIRTLYISFNYTPMNISEYNNARDERERGYCTKL